MSSGGSDESGPDGPQDGPEASPQDGPMIGIVVVTHGALAVELCRAMEHVVGPQARTETVCIGADDDMAQRRGDILDAVEKAESGAGVIVLTDMFGGTPSNLSISILDKANIEVIAGVNLPMLVKLASVRRGANLAEAVTQARDAGQKYIMVASQILKNPQ